MAMAMQTVLDDLGKGLGLYVLAEMIAAWGRCVAPRVEYVVVKPILYMRCDCISFLPETAVYVPHMQCSVDWAACKEEWMRCHSLECIRGLLQQYLVALTGRRRSMWRCRPGCRAGSSLPAQR